MQTLQDKSKNTVGYLYQNVILLPDMKVAGVLLAHYVHIATGEIKGKYFKECMYDFNGGIICKEGAGETPHTTIEMAAAIAKEAWQILSRTKNYEGPWVNPTTKWSGTTLLEFLTGSSKK